MCGYANISHANETHVHNKSILLWYSFFPSSLPSQLTDALTLECPSWG